MKYLKNIKLAWALIAIAGSVLVYSLFHRRIDVDDGWLAENSYFLAMLGKVKAESLLGWFNEEQKLFVYHKGFVIEGAAVIKAFGFNIWLLKSVSLVWLGGLIAGFWQLTKKFIRHRWFQLFSLAAILTLHHTVASAFTFRPEMAITALAIWTYIFLLKFDESQNERDLFLAAFLAGLAIFTHLNGAIIIAASILYLWSKRKWKEGFVFGGIAGWGVIAYFWDIRSFADLALLKIQFQNERDLSQDQFGLAKHFLNLIYEQQRYLHSLPEIFFTLFILSALFSARKFLKDNTVRSLLIYTLLMAFSLAFITHGTTAKYLLLVAPFWILLAISVLSEQFSKTGSITKLCQFFLFVFLAGSTIFNIYYFSHREYRLNDFRAISQQLPSNVWVLAPTEFMFAGLGQQKIQTYSTYNDLVSSGKLQKNADALFARASGFNIVYVIAGPEERNYYGITKNEYQGYILDKDKSRPGWTVYKRTF